MTRLDGHTRQTGAIAVVEARLALLGPAKAGEAPKVTAERRRLLAKLDDLTGGVPPDAIVPPDPEPTYYRPRERRDVDG